MSARSRVRYERGKPRVLLVRVVERHHYTRGGTMTKPRSRCLSPRPIPAELFKKKKKKKKESSWNFFQRKSIRYPLPVCPESWLAAGLPASPEGKKFFERPIRLICGHDPTSSLSPRHPCRRTRGGLPLIHSAVFPLEGGFASRRAKIQKSYFHRRVHACAEERREGVCGFFFFFFNSFLSPGRTRRWPGWRTPSRARGEQG